MKATAIIQQMGGTSGRERYGQGAATCSGDVNPLHVVPVLAAGGIQPRKHSRISRLGPRHDEFPFRPHLYPYDEMSVHPCEVYENMMKTGRNCG